MDKPVWFNEFDLVGWVAETEELLINQVGFLCGFTDKYLIMAASIAVDYGEETVNKVVSASGPIKIPWGCIKHVEVVRKNIMG